MISFNKQTNKRKKQFRGHKINIIKLSLDTQCSIESVNMYEIYIFLKRFDCLEIFAEFNNLIVSKISKHEYSYKVMSSGAATMFKNKMRPFITFPQIMLITCLCFIKIY